MSKTKTVVNTTIISQRMSERDGIIQEGKYLETLQSEGRTLESVIQLAKDKLGLEADGIIRLEFSDIVKKQNRDIQTFIQLGGAILAAEQTGLLSEEAIAPLKEVSSKLEKEIASRLNIEDVEDLYEEIAVEE